MADFIRHEPCDACGSKDNRAVYSDGSYYCWGCNDRKLSDEVKAELDEKHGNKKVKHKVQTKEKELSQASRKEVELLSQEENEAFKKKTSLSGKGYRNVRDDITKQFGVRYTIDETTGEVLAQHYPCTYEGQLSGYKTRKLPKDFASIPPLGETGNNCDMFGGFKFKSGGKYVVLVGGEVDALSAYQMLHDYNKSRGSEYEIAVVSPTTGENCQRQVANNYKFFDSFDQVILALDNDEAGKKAADKVVKSLPKGKVKLMNMRYKDPSEYLQAGKDKEFVQDFWGAKQYVPVGIVGSGSISEAMRAEFKTPKIPLPPFMRKLQDMMAGGVPLGRMVNLGSASGSGKSTIIDEIVYFMLFNSPYKVGIVTLESTCGQYGNKLLSRHIGKKLELHDNDTALSILEADWVKDKERELFYTETGDHRFFLIDNRQGSCEDVKSAIENLIISCGCKVIIADPVHDVIGQLTNEEQESFYSWQKSMMQTHNCTFYNVMHTRKTQGGQRAGSAGADLHEEDIAGASSAYKSAACNLMFTRNKEAEDDIERNTTIMKATKIRWTGKTGIAGKYYYDCEKHTLYDLDDYLNGKV